MRVNLIALGGRGDVWPYTALGFRLRQMGYAVKIATHREFESDIRAIGLGFIEISGSPRAMLESEAGRRWVDSGSNIIAHIRRSADATRPLMENGTRDVMKACLGAEAVIYSPMGFPASHFAERLGIPCIAADGVPQYRTRYYSSPFVWGGRSLSGPINWLSHVLIDQYTWQQMRRSINTTLAPCHPRGEMLPSASQTPAHWCLSDGVEWVPNTPKTPKQDGFPEDARAVLMAGAQRPWTFRRSVCSARPFGGTA